MLHQNVSGEDVVSVNDTLMLEGTEPPPGLLSGTAPDLQSGTAPGLLSGTAIMEGMTVTDILDIEGIPQGVIGVHRPGEELHQGIEVGEAGHHLYHAAHLTVLDAIAQAVARFAFVHLLV